MYLIVWWVLYKNFFLVKKMKLIFKSPCFPLWLIILFREFFISSRLFRRSSTKEMKVNLFLLPLHALEISGFLLCGFILVFFTLKASLRTHYPLILQQWENLSNDNRMDTMVPTVPFIFLFASFFFFWKDEKIEWKGKEGNSGKEEEQA
jgi:hypothetical protein